MDKQGMNEFVPTRLRGTGEWMSLTLAVFLHSGPSLTLDITQCRDVGWHEDNLSHSQQDDMGVIGHVKEHRASLPPVCTHVHPHPDSLPMTMSML